MATGSRARGDLEAGRGYNGFVKVVIAGIGTRGDLQPLLALGRALEERGHEALVCGPPDFVDLAAELGVRFKPFGMPFVEFLTQSQEMAERNPLKVFMGAIGRQLLYEQIEAVRPLLREADALIGNSLLLSGASLAQEAEVPYMKVIFQPVLLRAPAFPPPFVARQDLPGWLNLLLWKVHEGALNVAFLKLLNEARTKVGLAPVEDIPRHVYETSNFLMALDPALTGPLPDWQFPHFVTGFWPLRDHEASLPPQVEGFLSAGTPPVYVGFGSMMAKNPEARTRQILEAIRLTGQRAIVSSGWADLGRSMEPPPECLIIGPVSHAALFPRCKAIVHHGGAGTTSAAALAGRPQVVVPHLLDQHYWAHRVVQTGVGPRTFPVGQLSAARLASALARACGEPIFRERAEALSRVLLARDGLAEAVSAIEAGVGTRSAELQRTEA